jgi:hypothetical protein
MLGCSCPPPRLLAAGGTYHRPQGTGTAATAGAQNRNSCWLGPKGLSFWLIKQNANRCCTCSEPIQVASCWSSDELRMPAGCWGVA